MTEVVRVPFALVSWPVQGRSDTVAPPSIVACYQSFRATARASHSCCTLLIDMRRPCVQFAALHACVGHDVSANEVTVLDVDRRSGWKLLQR